MPKAKWKNPIMQQELALATAVTLQELSLAYMKERERKHKQKLATRRFRRKEKKNVRKK